MAKKTKKVADGQGLATNVSTEKGVMSNTQVFNENTMKDAWYELIDCRFEEKRELIEINVDNFDDLTDYYLYGDDIQDSLKEIKALGGFRDTLDIHRYEDIDFPQWLEPIGIEDKATLLEYAIDCVGIDEEIAKEMCNIFNKED